MLSALVTPRARFPEFCPANRLPAIPPPQEFCDGPNYLICYAPRSGSTHLTSLLRRTGVLGRPADVLNLDYQRLPANRQNILDETGLHTICDAQRIYGSQTVAEYLAHLTWIGRTPNAVFGMKADLYQASILMRRGLFRGGPLSWKYIYLTRTC